MAEMTWSSSSPTHFETVPWVPVHWVHRLPFSGQHVVISALECLLGDIGRVLHFCKSPYFSPRKSKCLTPEWCLSAREHLSVTSVCGYLIRSKVWTRRDIIESSPVHSEQPDHSRALWSMLVPRSPTPVSIRLYKLSQESRSQTKSEHNALTVYGLYFPVVQLGMLPLPSCKWQPPMHKSTHHLCTSAVCS